jgi:prepilin-type N-terminal cleavage/methylation domain-containing protein
MPPLRHPRLPFASRPGFTLVELLTVLAIIGVLAAILFPLVGSVRRSARTTQDVTIMRTFGQAMMQYASDNRGRINQHGSAGQEGYPHNTFMGRAWPYLESRNLSLTGLTAAQMAEVSNRYVSQVLLNEAPHLLGAPTGTRNSLAFNKGLAYPAGSITSPQRSDEYFRRLSEVARPAATVYAAVGSWGFNSGGVHTPRDLPAVQPAEAIYWPYSNKRTILIYLDGHASLWEGPISAAMSRIN